MTNRKIVVRIGSQHSSTYPLYNGIPQGSPLSVILFLIAYNKLYGIISINKEINLSAYADDLNLIIRSNGKNPVLSLNGLFDDIKNWCDRSGAVLSTTKCKYLHICRKINCHCTIQTGDFTICEVESLRLLGLYVNSRYNWKDHIEFLASSLSNRLNIVKYLSNFKLNCNTDTLISVTRALIISKINYGLQIYGYASRTNLLKIKSIMNTALRFATGAFRTTPIQNLLFESNVLPITTQRNILTTKLFRTIIYDSSTPLRQIARKLMVAKKIPKVPSVIYRTIGECRRLDIPLKATVPRAGKFPSWEFQRDSTNTSMSKFLKLNTSPFQFQSLFNEIKETLCEHTLIYTDGSKSDHAVTYGITTDNNIIRASYLPLYSSIFSAELIAIYEATLYLRTKRGKFVICTDSLSAIKSVLNIGNNSLYTTLIRDVLTEKYPNISLLWVPGHCKINGNEYADQAAKDAVNAPVFGTANLDQKDLGKFICDYYRNIARERNFNASTDWYRTINKDRKTIRDSMFPDISRLDAVKYTRLRLGHTRITHGHLLNINETPYCNCTANTNNLLHILSNCPKFDTTRSQIFKNKDPKFLLSYPTPENIRTITKFLMKSNLYNKI